jgi:hypothetical protein
LRISLFCHKSHQPTAPCWFYINDQRGCTDRRCPYPFVLSPFLSAWPSEDSLANVAPVALVQSYWARDVSHGFDSKSFFRFAQPRHFRRHQHRSQIGHQLSTSPSSWIRRACLVRSEASDQPECSRSLRSAHPSPLGPRRARSGTVDESGRLRPPQRDQGCEGGLLGERKQQLVCFFSVQLCVVILTPSAADPIAFRCVLSR